MSIVMLPKFCSECDSQLSKVAALGGHGHFDLWVPAQNIWGRVIGEVPRPPWGSPGEGSLRGRLGFKWGLRAQSQQARLVWGCHTLYIHACNSIEACGTSQYSNSCRHQMTASMVTLAVGVGTWRPILPNQESWVELRYLWTGHTP